MQRKACTEEWRRRRWVTCVRHGVEVFVASTKKMVPDSVLMSEREGSLRNRSGQISVITQASLDQKFGLRTWMECSRSALPQASR